MRTDANVNEIKHHESTEGVPAAWRWRHSSSRRWEYGEEKPEGPSIHLFEVQPLYHAPAGWQPIETAPKDGTVVDLWSGVRFSNCRWEAAPYAPNLPWGWTCQRLGRLTSATHWMPLPAPPEITS